LFAGTLVACVLAGPAPAQERPRGFVYPVKFLCGPSSESFQEGIVTGLALTAINVLNVSNAKVLFEKGLSRALPHQTEGPRTAPVSGTIGPFGAIEIECDEIRQMLPSQMTEEFRTGYLTLRSDAELVVTAVYSARGRHGEISTLQVLRIEALEVEPSPDGGVGTVGPRVGQDSSGGSVRPSRTEGAPYPPAAPPDWERFVPNEEWLNYPPVPKGPQRGDMTPNNPPVRLRSFEEGPPQEAPPINFDKYEEVDDLPNLSDLGEVSVAENGDTIIMTGNTWMALSEDAGTTFTYINPTTLFPQDDGGLCCDQIVMHIPRYDLFVWLMQYRSTAGPDGTNDNRIRIAVESTEGVRSSDGTSWTYWDFSSNVFNANGGLDYNDMTATGSNLYWISSISGGRVVVRVPLDELAKRTTVNFRYTGGTSAAFSHITQNPSNQVYWAGHIDTSQLRVYNWPDGDNSYYWRSININSWPNDSESSITPDGVDWMQWEGGITTYIYGNALQGSSVWLAWQAGRGGGFPHPHVQMVRLNGSTFALEEQVQIWNPEHAFQDAFLSTNAGGEFASGAELGMSVAFGGPPFHASHAVGVWGDFVVYYPTLSSRSATRWGDYNTARRSSSSPQQWVAGGYTLQTDGSGGNTTVPHYIKFGR
jgi:hypothetical protein